MRRATVLLILAALALPAAAEAKELTSVELCGADGCTTITDRERLQALPSGGEQHGAPPPAGAFFTMTLTVTAENERHTSTMWYVPSAQMLAGQAGDGGAVAWFPIFGEQANGAMRDAVAGLEPFPAPTITAARVGSRRVADDPQSYLDLYVAESAGRVVEREYDWMPVELVSERPSPWTVGPSPLAYSPSGKLLQRGPDLIRLPDGIASDLDAARPIAGGGRNVLPWLVLAALAAAIVVLAAGGSALRRRTPAPRVEPA